MKTLTLSSAELEALNRGATLLVVEVDLELEPPDEGQHIAISWVENVDRLDDDERLTYKYTGWLAYYWEYPEEGMWEIESPCQPGDVVDYGCYHCSECGNTEKEEDTNICPKCPNIHGLYGQMMFEPDGQLTIKDVRCEKLGRVTPVEVLAITQDYSAKKGPLETMKDFYQSTGREWDSEKWIWLLEVER